jgi:uncharacterized membrane protein YfhO
MNKKDYINVVGLVFLGLSIILIILGFENIYGSKTDWISQHWAFAEYFRTEFYNTGNIFPNFAFNIGAGQNIYNFVYYGLLNPIVMISYLLPFIKMVDYIMVVSIISVFASTFLFYKWLRNNSFSSKTAMISSSLFLMSGPLIFHSHRHIMFVDYIPFLILGLIGIDKYFSSGKRWVYILSVFLMIMTSYYYSVGGILVFVIYGIYKYLKTNKKITLPLFIIDGIKFCIPIIIGVLMASLLLLPTIGVILNGRSGIQHTAFTWSLLFPKFDLNPLLYSSYSLGFTAITIIALLFIFFSKKKEKLFLGIVVSIFLFIPVLMYILNGTLYIRAKVLIPFLPIIGLLLANFIQKILDREINYKNLFIVLIIFNIILYLTGYSENIYYIDIIITSIIIIAHKLFKRDYIFYIPIIIIAFISCLTVNKTDELVSKDLYNQQFDSNNEQLIKQTINNDKDLYRFNNLTETLATVNKIYHSNYYQTSLYSSTYNNYYNQFFFDTFNNAVPYRNRIITPQTNNIMFQTLMGVKYILSDSNVPIGYDLVSKDNNVGIYKNNDVFPIVYATSNLMNYEEFAKLKYPYKIDALLSNAVVYNNSNKEIINPIDKVNLQYEATVGSNLEIEKYDEKYVIIAKETDYIYLDLKEEISNQILFIKFDILEAPSCKDGDISISINGVINKLTCKSWMYHNGNYRFEYSISSPLNIKQLEIKFTKGEFNIINLETFLMDYDYIKQAVTKIDAMTFDMKKTKGDKIVGNIEVSEDGYLVTTIPYDKGFNILLNGKNYDYGKVNDSFIGLPIKKGTYSIEIRYEAPLSKVGLYISTVGFIIFIIIIMVDKKKRGERYEI